MERIVVGVDGSPGSIDALEWAVAEGVLRGAMVEVVHSFHVPYAGGTAVVPLVLDPAEFQVSAEALLDKAIAQVDATALGGRMRRAAIEGPAALVLVEAARDAAMLVVGARGHGGLAGMLMGSISRQVSEHASVPVVIVPRSGS